MIKDEGLNEMRDISYMSRETGRVQGDPSYGGYNDVGKELRHLFDVETNQRQN
jgi:hypothetical protein